MLRYAIGILGENGFFDTIEPFVSHRRDGDPLCIAKLTILLAFRDIRYTALGCPSRAYVYFCQDVQLCNRPDAIQNRGAIATAG